MTRQAGAPGTGCLLRAMESCTGKVRIDDIYKYLPSDSPDWGNPLVRQRIVPEFITHQINRHYCFNAAHPQKKDPPIFPRLIRTLSSVVTCRIV